MSGSPYLARTELLLGAAAMDALDRARVLVVGVGGVGGWCAEALVRSGVRHLTLVDSDRVAPSNVNRQVMATPSTVGEPKVEALRRLLLALNPAAEIEARALRYEPGSDAIDFGAFDYVVDAIDSVDCKADLIRSVLAAPRTTLFSSLGAARKTDVFRIRRDAFRKVAGDGLARALRNRFRKDGAWPERPFTCVWSDEPPAENLGAPDVGEDARANGTVMHVTAAFGLALAGLVIERIRAEIYPCSPQAEMVE